jgi:hypothetical protein
MTTAQVAASLANVETEFRTLPHTNVASDLNALASQMVSSGAYRQAVVNPGGITGILPDGQMVVVFADRLEDLGYTASARSRSASAPLASRVPEAAGSITNHAMAILVNQHDPAGAFNVTLDQAEADAFGSVFGTTPGYGATDVDMSLDNIVALGQSNVLDFLEINTHGNVAGVAAPNLFYIMSTTTALDPAVEAKYSADFNKTMFASVTLTISQVTGSLATYSVTPQFLTKYLTFNSGAIVIGDSCLSANMLIVDSVTAAYKSANVGRYYGWTKSVVATDDDQTQAFMDDRLLGENSDDTTGLKQYITPQSPPQRPFPLDDVYTAMGAETRSGPLGTEASEFYTVSDAGPKSNNAAAPPTSDGTVAKFAESDLGGESVAAPPIEYGFPSIETMSLAEASTSGTLTIAGNFPVTPGTVSIQNSSGSVSITPTSWTTSSVQVAIPDAGAGSNGNVQVVGDGGVFSNPVPLTEWQGQLLYNEHDYIPTFNGTSGAGSGTFGIQANLSLRADVHPVVTAIDTAPVPQNLFFPQVMGNSTAPISGLQGGYGYTDAQGADQTVTFTLTPAAFSLVLAPALPPLPDGTFELHAPPVGGAQPEACNAATPGPAATGDGTVYCPFVGFKPGPIGACTDTGSTSGCTVSGNWLTSFGISYAGNGGVMMLTLNPSNYQMSLTTTPGSFDDGMSFGGTGRTGTSSLNGTFNAPINPPSAATPALRAPGEMLRRR